MTVVIEKSSANGTVLAPPSKSDSHRALICAALANGISTVKNIQYSNDIIATLNCLETMGASVKRFENAVEIGGLNPEEIPECTLDCLESGSTLRFLIPICMLSENIITFTGSERLFARNLEVYETLAKQNGIYFEQNGNTLKLKGKLGGGKFSVRGDISSQFISGLAFALPLCKNESEIEVTGRYESAPYVALTVQVMQCFGVQVQKAEPNVYKIKAGQSYKNIEYTVEGDYSNAAFLDGFNLLGGCVTVQGLSENSLQGDSAYKEMFEQLRRGKKSFDLSATPDLAPVMFALAAAMGGAKFTGTARLKIKESDRAAAMAEELSKFGIKTVVKENEVEVCSGNLCKPTKILYGHNDHRIVMALSLLCSVTGGSISDAQAVAKSFPDFFRKIKSIGIMMKNES